MVETKVITVSGNAGEVDSGIDLAVDDVVEMSASGQVGHHEGQGASDFWNPDGTSANKQEGGIVPGPFVFPDLPAFSLIGWVGDGDPFVVGFQSSHSVTESGRLYFEFNDHKGAHGNNTGQYDVKVKITRSGKAVQDSCGVALDRLKGTVNDFIQAKQAKGESTEKLPNLTVTSCPVPYSNGQVKTNGDEAARNGGQIAGLCFKAPKGRKLTITEEGQNVGGGTLFYVPPGCTITWVDATFPQRLVDAGYLSKGADGAYTRTVKSRREGAGAAATDDGAESWLREQWLENWHSERWVETVTDGEGREIVQEAFRRTYSFTLQNDGAVLIFPRSSEPGTVSFKATLE